MPKNTPNTLRTKAYILKRTNYEEADRILNIITPSGKIVAIAKGVRREKSKLASGIEIFSLVDLNLHFSKSEFAVVTSAKMVEHYGNIVKDLAKIELASEILLKINRTSEGADNSEFFEITDQSLKTLNQDYDIILVQIWFLFNLAKATGEDINLYRDTDGNKLDQDQKYTWDAYEKSLKKDENGNITSNEIKTMRLILTNKIPTIAKIKNIDEMLPSIFNIAKSL